MTTKQAAYVMAVDTLIRVMHLIACPCLLLCFSLFGDSSDIGIKSAYRTTFSDDIGYTLIGAKPVSNNEIHDYYLYTNPKICEAFISSLQELFHGSDRFVFKVFAFGNNMYEMELINKRALRALVSKSDLLQEFIKENFSSRSTFYETVEDKNIRIFSGINSMLIKGILFGYGKENAEYFCRLCELGRYLKKYPYVKCFEPYLNVQTCVLKPQFPGRIYAPYADKVPELSTGFDSLEAEWKWLETIGFTRRDREKERKAAPPYFVNLPTYIYRRGAESDAIRAKHIRAQAKIANLFSGKSYKQAVEDEVRRK